jgi:hypothetical protein
MNACGGVNKNFDSDQKVFILTIRQTLEKVKIGIPCK